MPSYEIEQKFKIEGPEKYRRLFKKLGAKKRCAGKEDNELFDKDRSLIRFGKVLRLRSHGKKVTLTFKGPRLPGKVKKRVEIETSVGSFKDAKNILDALGYEKIFKYTKKREEYVCGKTILTIDQVPGLGWFIEIEGSKKEITRLQKQLQLKESDIEHRSYIELIRTLLK